MRRPRSKLEVSTFPFLAVLLCIMGSLMLLLFIMDRRAKIAARFHVTEELQARQSRSKAEEDARQAEWEKAKQQLHVSLQQQQGQLLAESQGFQANLSEAGNKLALVQARHTGLEEKIKSESAKIGTRLLDIEGQRAGLQQADKKETMSKAELIEAAKELAELERAFLQLRALRESEKQVHSVVPYRGKRGDLRTPIYIECVRDGVHFHPENKPLQALDLTALGLRSEVERRFGPLAVQKSAKEKDEAKGPYVLFLIRPDGIANYYKSQSALKGFEVDFGYELVDAGWVLDFAGETHAKGAPSTRPSVPWKPGEEPRPTIAPPASQRLPPGSLGPPLFASKPPGGLLAGPSGAGNGNAGAPRLTPLSGGPEMRNSHPAPPFAGGNPPYAGVDTGIPAKPPAFVPIAKGTPSLGGASSGVSPINAPIPGNSVGGHAPKASTQPGGGTEDSTGKSFPAFGADQGKKSTAASPLSKLLGNKDFAITIECRRDAVTVDPSGLIYRWASSNTPATDAALVQTVTSLIARRQASVRSGEPPYRPLICFHVSPDGLRTYLHVYPLLEQLRVPMTRENVEE